MAEHTPGPWSWDAGDIGNEYSIPYCDVFAGSGDDFIIASVNDRFDRTQGRANARLIAAAPDLLEALEDAVRWFEAYVGDADHGRAFDLTRAKAVIAKAREQS